LAPSQRVDERAEIIPDDLGQGSQDLELSETVPGVVSVWLVGKPVAPTIVVEDDHLSLSENKGVSKGVNSAICSWQFYG